MDLYNFTTLTHDIHVGLAKSFSPFLATTIEWVIVGVAYLTFVALFGLILVYVERKVCAAFQQRLGPMRVGKFYKPLPTLLNC